MTIYDLANYLSVFVVLLICLITFCFVATLFFWALDGFIKELKERYEERHNYKGY